MTGFPLHVACLAVVAIWLRARPSLPLRRAFALWWAGLLLARVAPQLIAYAVPGAESGGIPSWVPEVVGVSGSLILLRVIGALTLFGRPWRLRDRVYAAGAVLALLVSASNREAVVPLSLLAVPWLYSIRWREELGAGGLTLASLTGLLSFFLSIASIGPGSGAAAEAALRGIGTFRAIVTMFVAWYCVLGTQRVAGRIHLSIRRIGRRLFLSHTLAGLVPVTLVALFLLLAGALFLSTYRGAVATRLLLDASASASVKLASEFRASGAPPEAPFGEDAREQSVLVRRGAAPARIYGPRPAFPPDSLLAREESSIDVPLVFDGERLFLRARFDTLAGGEPVRIEALAPIDSLRMVRVSGILGVPVRLSPDVQVYTSGRGIVIGDSEISRRAAGTDTGGDAGAGASSPAAEDSEPRPIGPPRPGGLSLPGGSVVYCLTWRDPGWFVPTIPVTSSAGFGEEIVDLITSARRNPLATVVLVVLGILAVLLIGVIWVATMMVVDMARSIAGAVRALTGAAGALREGRFDHRIEIEGKDELWTVAASFNDMAEGLERLRAVERESQRLEEELRLAREIQDRLLPAGPPAVPGLELAGLSIPAREVGGDYYDYLPLPGGRVGIALADVSGKGAPAALLMSSFRASLRSQDLEVLGPAETLARINRFLHASVEPGKFITAFLAVIDPATGSMRYVNAGHEPPVLLARGETIEELPHGGLLLGVVPEARYEETEARLEKGALLAVFSDGVTEARRGDGEFYGAERLLALLREEAGNGNGVKALADRLVREVRTFADGAPQYDDITLVLARRL